MHLLPQASLLTFSDSQLNIRPYSSFKYPDLYEDHGEEFYVEQLNHYLRQAVTRQERGDRPSGMLLSGGSDFTDVTGHPA